MFSPTFFHFLATLSRTAILLCPLTHTHNTDSNATMGTDGALPDCIPYYGHGHKDADPGWGIAAWTITDWFSDYFADDVFDVAWYPRMKWYANHWINITAATPDGIFPLFL